MIFSFFFFNFVYLNIIQEQFLVFDVTIKTRHFVLSFCSCAENIPIEMNWKGFVRILRIPSFSVRVSFYHTFMFIYYLRVFTASTSFCKVFNATKKADLQKIVWTKNVNRVNVCLRLVFSQNIRFSMLSTFHYKAERNLIWQLCPVILLNNSKFREKIERRTRKIECINAFFKVGISVQKTIDESFSHNNVLLIEISWLVSL